MHTRRKNCQRYRPYALVLALLLAPSAWAQVSQGVSIHFKNQSVLLGSKSSGFVTLNCTTNMTCSYSGSTFTITGSGGATPRLDQILDPTADKTFAMGSHILSFSGVFTIDPANKRILSTVDGASLKFDAPDGLNNVLLDVFNNGSTGLAIQAVGINATSTLTTDAFAMGNGAIATAALFVTHTKNTDVTDKGALQGIATRILLQQVGNTATSATAILIGSAISNGQTTPTLIGLDIQNQTIGASNWAIKTGLGLVSFGDTVLIRATSVPTATFPNLKNGSAYGLYMAGDNVTATPDILLRSLNAPTILSAISNGTLAAPTAVTATTSLYNLIASGFGATDYQFAGGIEIFSDTTTFTDTNHSAHISLRVTPPNAPFPQEYLRIAPSLVALPIGTMLASYNIGLAFGSGVAVLDTTNFERNVFRFDVSNVAEVGAEKGGTGTLRSLRLLGANISASKCLGTDASTLLTSAAAPCVTSAAALTNNGVVIGGGSQASSTISVDSTATHALFATAGAPAFRAIATGDLPAVSVPLSGSTGSIGGGQLTIGTCTSGTAAVTGATTAMTATASPVTYPGDGNYWLAYVSANDVVTVKVCAVATLTPTASVYRVRVLQ